MAAQKRSGGQNYLDDLVMLDKISEDRIMEVLKNRYGQDSIYTNIGPVLIAINPFKMIAAMYTEARIREYRGKKFFEMPPHVYALADETYSNMISYRENQCVIISGESGSGKTETSKIIMQYISSVSGKSTEVQRVKERMLSSNPVLEAFGNAKTVNNNNSSRFGKYMEILFDYGGDPVGGRVTNYLLEKSRVVGPGKSERNFHIFYQVCAGATAEQKRDFTLEGPDYYYYLSVSECYKVDGIADLDDWKEVVEALGTLGFPDEEVNGLVRAIAIVLWLGNIAFSEDNNEKAYVQDKAVLDIAAGLLGVQSALLEKALTTRKLQTGAGAKAEVFTKPNKASEADFCRDTLSKAIYSRMFDYLVARINSSIRKENFKGVQIGVLDIYGFEIFQNNSFEQLCINFVNERLQQIFIELTLKAEQEEYKAEGIPWKDIQYYNNKPICDLIENKPGILSICDDCCNTAKTDQMFMQDIRGFFSGNQSLMVGNDNFTIQHYAGSVRYAADGFLTKNKDLLFDDLTLTMQASPHQFVKDHGWFDIKVADGQKKRPVTVGFQFKQQVQLLMGALMACVPHYIRCIKPNMEKTPNNFDFKNTQRQVQYLGLLENVRVRRAGYAHRSHFTRFIRRYGLLSDDVWSKKARGDEKTICRTLCQGLHWTEGKEYALGKTKIFIQDATTLFQLEDALERKQNDACMVIQKAWKNYAKKREYLEIRYRAWEVVNGKKERRRASVARDYKGDYLDFAYNKLVVGLLGATGTREKLLFADLSKTAQLKGKKGFFKSLFGGNKEELMDQRFLVLSDKALYSFTFFQEEKKQGDTAPKKTQIKMFYRVPSNQIDRIVVSPYADNYMIFHFAAATGVTDTLVTCRRKTEFLGVLAMDLKKQQRQLNVSFVPNDTLLVNPKKKKNVEIKWVRDPMLAAGGGPGSEEKLTVQQSGAIIEIKVAAGLSPQEVKQPVQPGSVQTVARSMLRAMYDCKGNGIDELGFKTGDLITILKDVTDGWYEGELKGKRGFVPETYVEKIKVAADGKQSAGGAAKARPAAAQPAAAAAAEAKSAVPAGGRQGTAQKTQFGRSAALSIGMRGVDKKALQAAAAAPAPVAARGAASDWKEMFTDDGEKYYWNEKEQRSEWELPASELAKMIKTETKKAQETKRCTSPGCTNVQLSGKQFCVTHERTAATKTVAKQATVNTGAGARTATTTTATKSTAGAGAVAKAATVTNFGAAKTTTAANTGASRNATAATGGTAKWGGGTGAAAGGVAAAKANVAATFGKPGGAAAVAKPAVVKKKSPWTEEFDESSGQPYWFNHETQESSWDKPADA